ncbi:MAG TPA: TonB-dependent receptor [Thiobacillus sp.]
MRQTRLAIALGLVFASSAVAETLPEFVGDTIVVTPTRFEESAPRTPGNLIVITQQDIERTPATSVPDLLAGTVGTMVTPLYGALGIDASVSLRGSGSGGTTTSNTLVLLNGQRLNPIDSGSIDWSLIPLSSIERIEVMPGSGTVLYGDRSTGGVINIITKKLADTRYVSAGVGSYGLRELSLQTGASAGSTDGSLYFQYGASDGWRTNSNQERYSLGGRVNFLNEAGKRAFVDLAAFQENLGQPGGLWSAEYAEDPTKSRHPHDSSDRKGFRIRPGFELDLSPDVRLDADLVFSRDERSGYSDPTNPVEQTRDLSRDFVSFSPKLRIRHWLGGLRNQATVGFDYYRGTTDTLTSPTGHQAYTQAATQTSNAVYAQNITDLRERLALTLGVRSQRVEQSASQSAYTTYWGGPQAAMSGQSVDTREAYEAGLSYRADDWKVYGRVGTTYRFPNTDELYGLDPLTYDPVFAFGLRPQHGTTYEIGGTKKIGLGSLGFSVYQQDLKDEITSDPNGGNMNVPRTRRRGTELNANLKLTSALRGNLGVTLEDAEIRAGAYAGRTVPLVPKVQASAGLTWSRTAAAAYSARLNYVGKRRYGDDYANAAGYLAGYTKLDLMASWRIRDWTIDARVLNATDKKYAAYGGYGFNSGTFAYDTFYYPADRRTFGVSARYDFR